MELLVAITIIVILLALLTPALDRAIYQAELVQCAAKQKVIAAGSATYAVEHARFLPHVVPAAGKGWITCTLYRGGLPTAQPIDARTLYSPYMDIEQTMNDPFIKPLELETATTSIIYGSYSLYNNWLFSPNNVPSDKTQRRLGDRFNWRGFDKASPTEEYSWDILSGDFMRSVGGWWTSHPDQQGIATLSRFTPGGPAPPYDYTSSYWTTPNANTLRGDVDVNFARQDGSVRLYRDVAAYDSEFVLTSENSSGDAGLQHLLPKR